MISMGTKMVSWLITLVTLMTITSQKRIYQRRFPTLEIFRLGALDTSQPLQYYTLREGQELLVRSNQAFRGETMPRDIDLPKPSTHLMLLKKLLELFPELVEGGEWDVREGCFRNVLDFLNLPLTHGVNSNEFGRNYRCFRPQRVEVDIFDLLDYPMDEDQVTLLAVLDYCNMSLHDTRRNNFVLSELLLWTKYLQCTLQKMYEVAGDLDYEKETLKEELTVAEA